MQIISVTKKNFPNSSLHHGNLDSILNIFKKKMSLIADLFFNLRTPKNVVRSMFKKSRFRGPSEK